jgi:S1-C subfamily serine protease
MLKKIVLLFLFLLFTHANEKIQKLENSILRLATFKGEKISSTGTSFYIGHDIFVTNYHVVSQEVEKPEKYKTFVLTGINNGKIDRKLINILDYSKDSDLALVKVEGLNKHPLVFSIIKNIHTSEDVYAIGYPSSSDMVLMRIL